MRTCSWGAAPEDACLNLLGQLEQSTTDSVAYKQHKFISYSCGGWELQDQGPSMLMFWGRPSSWVTASTSSLCPHMVEGGRELSGASFIRHESHSLRHLPNSPPPNTIISEHWDFNTHMSLIAPRHVGSSGTRDWTYVPCMAGGFLTTGPSGRSQNFYFYSGQNIEGTEVPSNDKWIKKIWYIYTMEYYSVIKRIKSCHLWQHGYT